MRQVLPLLLLLAACSSAPADRGSTANRTPEVDKKYKEAAARGEVKIGMIQSEVRTAMGDPKRTKRTTYRRQPATCWSYINIDIYFDDEGFVIGWQSAYG
jgi:hypothetical protein